jgi:L-asparaginase / beta-aspartyl-peptidase
VDRSRLKPGTFVVACAAGLGLLAGAQAPRQPKAAPKVVLVIHGGAGVLDEKEMAEKVNGKPLRAHYEEALFEALAAGYKVLKRKKKNTSVDAVEAAIRVMEDCELFNAGRGGTFTHDGRVELDAAIMEGKMEGKGEGKRDPRKRAGAVAGVTRLKNPISAARAVMEMDGQRHVLLAGPGAERFALREPVKSRYGIEEVSNVYFWTDRRLKQIRDAVAEEGRRKKPAGDDKGKGRPRQDKQAGRGAGRSSGTAGAVALDGNGNLAAGTSTGGLANRLAGRVGDTPLIGAGTYADDNACGVSCTGTGEVFIRHAVAHDVVARMLYKKIPVKEAAQEAITALPDETDGGVGGLIALDRSGRPAFAMSKHSLGMYRGYVTEDGEIYVAIFAEETGKRMKGFEGKKGGGKGEK